MIDLGKKEEKFTTLGEIWNDLDELYLWMDSILETNCPPGCNHCCQIDVIYLTLPELLRMVKHVEPEPQQFGCPFRSDFGCQAYDYRPIVCRSFGPMQYEKEKNIGDLAVTLDKTIYVIAGPGMCGKHKLDSSVNLKELKQIYECYATITQQGIVAIGRCNDPLLQKHVEHVCNLLQQNSPHKVYCPDGKPDLPKIEKKIILSR